MSKRVNEMAGGPAAGIDYLVGGAVVHPFQVFDGVHGGQIDAAHTVTVYWYGKHKAASLFGTGPVFGFNANEGLGWIPLMAAVASCSKSFRARS